MRQTTLLVTQRRIELLPKHTVVINMSPRILPLKYINRLSPLVTIHQVRDEAYSNPAISLIHIFTCNLLTDVHHRRFEVYVYVVSLPCLKLFLNLTFL